MKIIYNSILPVKGFIAMALFGVIFARKEHSPLSISTINHETIHEIQVKEVGGWCIFYLLYFVSWLKNGYMRVHFEQDAYKWQSDIDKRPPKYWKSI